jgi:hypothetical protein
MNRPVAFRELPLVPLLPLLVGVPVLHLHRLVGQVEVAVKEVAVHLLLCLLGSRACLDPLLPPPHLPSPARICHQDILMTLAWGVLLRTGQVRSSTSSPCTTYVRRSLLLESSSKFATHCVVQFGITNPSASLP